MPAQIRFKSFRKSDLNGQPSHDFNLTNELRVHPDIIPDIQATLSDFKNLPQGAELGLELDQKDIRLRRVGEGNLQVAPAEVGNIYDYLTQQLGLDNLPVLQKLLVITPNYEYLHELLTRLQSVSVFDPRVAEIQGKIDELEARISKQRDIDNTSLKIGELETAVESIKSQLQMVQELVQKRNQLALKLQQLQATDSSSQTEETQAEWRKQISDLRQQELLRLQNIKTDVAKLEIEHEQPQFARVLIGLGIAVLVGGLVSSILTSTIWPAILGILGMVLEIAVFFVINKIPAKFNINSHISISQQAVSVNSNNSSESKTQINNLENRFVHNAWVGVLKHEVEMIGETIKTQLEGEDFQTVQGEQSKLEQQINEMKAKIDSYSGQDINPEDYLRLRREMDLLKIEKAKLEGFPDNNAAQQSALQALAERLNVVETGAKFTLEDLESNQQIRPNLLIEAVFEYWVSIGKVWPLVFINSSQNFSAEEQAKLDDKISKHNNSGQILIIESQA